MKLITNTKKYNVLDALDKYSLMSDEIEVVVPFFTDNKTVEKWIELEIKVSLTIALRYPTNPDSIQRIYSEIDLKFNKNKLHSKIYIFMKNSKVIAGIIGSSNFTSGGLINNLEANLIIEDKPTLMELVEEIQKIKADSQILEPCDLLEYRKHYFDQKKFSENLDFNAEKYNKKRRSSHSDLGKISVEARRYLQLWKFSDEICSLVKDISKDAWPEVPIYLAVSHFWHWIKTQWSGYSKSPQQRDQKWREKYIPSLFCRYIAWDKAEGNYTLNLPSRVNKFQESLSINNIDKLSYEQTKEIYSLMHCGNMRIRRFNGDEILMKENSIQNIRKSLKYLLYSDDEIVQRIHKLTHRGSDYKLVEFSKSAVQEIIGWVHCETMPIRNKKADDAVIALGFNFI